MNAKNGKKRKRAIKNNGDGPEKALKNEKKERYTAIFSASLLCLAAAVLLAALISAKLSAENTLLAGSQPYLHARMAESISEGDYSGIDNMIHGSRIIALTPYHYALGWITRLTGSFWASVTLPLLSAMTSLASFFFIARKTKTLLHSITAAAMLVTSPAFLSLALISSPDSMAIALTLLGFTLFFSDNRISRISSLLAFGIASQFSAIFLALIIIGLLFSALISLEKRTFSIASIIFLTVIYGVHPSPLTDNYEMPIRDFIGESLSDFGSMHGFSVFFLMLAIIGFFSSWKEKKKDYPIYASIAGFIMLALVTGSHAQSLLVFPLAILAGQGIVKVTSFDWRFDIIRTLTYVLIACGIIFSTLSYGSRLVDAAPSEDLATALSWLKNNSNEERVILSNPDNGYWIEWFSTRKAFIDSYHSTTQAYGRKNEAAEEVFYESAIEEAQKKLDLNEIDYLLITPDMRLGEIWNKDDQGLLRLLRNNETFKNVYAKENIEIWKVLRRDE
ncbi:MAG TPA: hypothetical protein VJI75_01535 [Candidatus Nanoarchaeia archaeon]|nr:hypothetical protein [Candidatus Nanoarchaeia archaeon]